jgi:hypothetical protein
MNIDARITAAHLFPRQPAGICAHDIVDNLKIQNRITVSQKKRKTLVNARKSDAVSSKCGRREIEP